MLESNPKREIPNFEKRMIREKEFMVQSRDLVGSEQATLLHSLCSYCI